ncbi:MAG: hypothetical protein ACPLPX_01440 [Candidatus Kapaibacteriota bacterium]
MSKVLSILVLIFITALYQKSLTQETKDTIETKSSSEIIGTPLKKYHFLNFKQFKHPSITVFSGLNYPSFSKISPNAKFNTQNFASIHLGTTKIKLKELKDGRKVTEILKSGLFIGNYSSKWKVKGNENIDATMWRFGIDFSDDGYGYKLGSNNFLFFTHGNSFIWSKFDVTDLSKFQQPDSMRYATFSEQFRFGTSYQSGLSLILLDKISVDLRYERSIVFPGHKFWYWTGSWFIEGIGQFLLDQFIREIVFSSPYSAPIVNAVLKGALSYGIYELRKDKMNWPFNTEPPLFNDNFKIGLTFIF